MLTRELIEHYDYLHNSYHSLHYLIINSKRDEDSPEWLAIGNEMKELQEKHPEIVEEHDKFRAEKFREYFIRTNKNKLKQHYDNLISLSSTIQGLINAPSDIDLSDAQKEQYLIQLAGMAQSLLNIEDSIKDFENMWPEIVALSTNKTEEMGNTLS